MALIRGWQPQEISLFFVGRCVQSNRAAAAVEFSAEKLFFLTKILGNVGHGLAKIQERNCEQFQTFLFLSLVPPLALLLLLPPFGSQSVKRKEDRQMRKFVNETQDQRTHTTNNQRPVSSKCTDKQTNMSGLVDVIPQGSQQGL